MLIIKSNNGLLFHRVLTFVIVCLLFSGCVAFRNRQPLAPVEPVPFEHTVQYSGETLALIAAWYTGDSKNWMEIQKANPSLNPNLIVLGQKILIPDSLMVKRESLTAEAVNPSLVRKGGKRSASGGAAVNVVKGGGTGRAEKVSERPQGELDPITGSRWDLGEASSGAGNSAPVVDRPSEGGVVSAPGEGSTSLVTSTGIDAKGEDSQRLTTTSTISVIKGEERGKSIEKTRRELLQELFNEQR